MNSYLSTLSKLSCWSKFAELLDFLYSLWTFEYYSSLLVWTWVPGIISLALSVTILGSGLLFSYGNRSSACIFICGLGHSSFLNLFVASVCFLLSRLVALDVLTDTFAKVPGIWNEAVTFCWLSCFTIWGWAKDWCNAWLVLLLSW